MFGDPPGWMSTAVAASRPRGASGGGGSAACTIAYWDEWKVSLLAPGCASLRPLTPGWTAWPCLSSQVWQYLDRYFLAHIPLRDVRWNGPGPGGTNSLYAITALPVQVLPQDDPSFRNLANINGFRAPYVYINFVVCESADAYKTSIKAKVKAWVDERVERQVRGLSLTGSQPHAPREATAIRKSTA
jgi:hypothetical protein